MRVRARRALRVSASARCAVRSDDLDSADRRAGEAERQHGAILPPAADVLVADAQPSDPCVVVSRLRFELLAERHAELLFGELGDPQLYTYIPDDPPRSVTELAARFTRLAAGSPRHDEIWRNWVMFDRTAQPIGTLQASIFSDHRALIAYMVFSRHWRQGYASAGVRWMLREVAERDHARLAEAFIDTRNRASIALVQRLGFTLRTTIRDADSFKGSTSDEYVYELPLEPRTDTAATR